MSAHDSFIWGVIWGLVLALVGWLIVNFFALWSQDAWAEADNPPDPKREAAYDAMYAEGAEEIFRAETTAAHNDALLLVQSDNLRADLDAWGAEHDAAARRLLGGGA